MSGGKALAIPLLEEHQFLPEIGEIDPAGAKIMYLNYPNNPTGAVAGRGFLREAVDFARDRNIVICYDNAYSEMSFGEAAHSILEIPGALDCCVEFNSCSKTFNMTGARIGFAVGAADAVGALAKVKSQMDSGLPPYVQRAGAYALSLYKGREPPAGSRGMRKRTSKGTGFPRARTQRCRYPLPAARTLR